MFNPHQRRDKDGQFAGGGYVGRRRAATSVDRASRSIAPKQAKSRAAAARAAHDKKVAVGTTSVVPSATPKALAARAANDKYRRQLLSGEIRIESASPTSLKKFGKYLPPEYAAAKFADPKIEAFAAGHIRDRRQRRSSKPAVARTQKAGRIDQAEPENRVKAQRPGRRAPVFPKQARARSARA